MSAKKVKLTIAAVAVPAMMILTLMQGAKGASANPQNPNVALYNSKCAVCHAADGSGSTVKGKELKCKDLRSAEVQKMSDEEMYKIIAKGKKKMPAYETTLGADKCKQLTAYMRELAKKK